MAKLLISRLIFLLPLVAAWVNSQSVFAAPMYRITKGDASFYLIGSAHMPMSGVSSLSNNWQKILQKAPLICTESPSVSDTEMSAAYNSVATESVQGKAKDKFEKRILQEVFMELNKRYKISDQAFDRLTEYAPYYFADAVSSFVAIDKIEGESIDQMLLDEIARRHLPSCAVETISESLVPGRDVDLDEAKSYLDYALRLLENDSALKKLNVHMHKIDEMYAKDQIAEICEEEEKYSISEGILPILTKTIESRNVRQAEKVLAIGTKKNGGVFAVGALHLCGKGGLLEIFRTQDYRVEAVLN